MPWLVMLSAALAEPLQTTLDNGLTVTVVEDDAMPRVAVQHWIDSGSAADPADHPGLAHLVEHLIVRDSGLEAALSMSGGTLSAFTAADYTRYTALVPPEHLAQTLCILTPVTLRAETLASAQRVVAEELAQRSGYAARLRAAIDAAYWRSHPYGSAAGWMLTVPALLPAEAAAEFIAARYQPGSAHVVIVGPIREAEALAAVEAAYGDLPGHPAPALAPPEPAPERIRLSTGPAAVRVGGLIWPLPPTDHPDQPLLQLALHGLSESAPSLLPGALSAGGHTSWGRAGGRLLLSGVYSALSREERVRADLNRAAGLLAGWLSEERLQQTRSAVVSATLRQRLDAETHARAVGWSVLMRGGVRPLEEEVAWLDALTLETIEAVWRRWIVDAEPIEVLVDVD